MHKVPLTYTNFNGVEVTKDFYFNLTEAELALRELESDNTFSQTLETLKNSTKGSEVFPEFQKIIKWTYGEKSADGESFIKSDAAWDRFANTEPWSALMMKLLSEPDFAVNFINQVVPKNLQQSTDGFRPGADTTRPTPPVAGPQVTQAQPFSQPVQPVQPAIQQPQAPANPTWNNPPIIPGGYTEGAGDYVQGVERTSAPRDWTPPAPPQQ